MTTPGHLTTEQLLGLKEPGSEPGLEVARAHLDACAECQAELDRLYQRTARLRALATLRPARDHWPVIQARLARERRRRRMRAAGIGGLALAASVAGVVLVGELTRPPVAVASTEISQAMEHSHRLEEALQSLDPDSRVTDGLTARVAGELEDRIAVVDRQLEMAQMLEQRAREEQMLRLWRERVGLLDALVDVHLTRATKVGL